MIKGFIRDDYVKITRQKYSSVGDGDFYLYAYRDPCLFLTRGVGVFLGPTGNPSLTPGVDYFISTRDKVYGGPTYCNEDVGSTLRILNSNYFDVDLYIDYFWVADYASAEMFNRFDRGLDQMINSIVTSIDGKVVVNNEGNVVSWGLEYPGDRIKEEIPYELS